MARLAIDPVTRVGGHLRIEATVDGGVVADAWSAGTMFRGIERILVGRDARDAWLLAQRVCGACTTVHALASVRAVEQALGIVVPGNARLLRNVMAGTQLVRDHVVGFYHRQLLDWVDVAAARTADPAATARLAGTTSDWLQSSPIHFGSVRDRLRTLAEVAAGGPLAGGPSGHPSYLLGPEESLLLLSHYVAALDWTRRVAHVNTLLGGKSPHPQTFLVGGLALAPAWGGPRRPGEHPPQVDARSPVALSARGLSELDGLIAEARTFVDQVLVPDAVLLARAYADWAATGRGGGSFLAFGDFAEIDQGQSARFLPQGRIAGADMAVVASVEQAAITESIAQAHYRSADGDDGRARHPSDGEADPFYGGPQLPYQTLDGAPRYSWLKAPRYAGEPMEVGPLARMLVASAEGRDEVRAVLGDVVGRVGMEPEGLASTLGRIVARAIEAKVVADRLPTWLDAVRDNLAAGDLVVANLAGWDRTGWAAESEGWSLGEGPRGAVGHWVRIRDGRIARYAIVDGSTWNASPRDGQGRRGPLEEALVGTPVADPERPVEILRTVHSFDPCPACAVHLTGGHSADAVEIAISGGGQR